MLWLWMLENKSNLHNMDPKMHCLFTQPMFDPRVKINKQSTVEYISVQILFINTSES